MTRFIAGILIAMFACAQVIASPTEDADALTVKATAELSRGDYSDAVADLQHAVTLDPQDAGLKIQLAQAYVLARSDAMRMSYLPAAQQLLDQVKDTSDPRLQAAWAESLGDLRLAQHLPIQAAAAYQSAQQLALSRNDTFSAARAAANAAVAYLAEARMALDALDSGDTTAAQARLAIAVPAGRACNSLAWKLATDAPQTQSAALLLLTIGQTDEGLSALQPTDSAALLRAYAAYQKALAIADSLHDRTMESYALGYTGHLYELNERIAEAQRLTRSAMFIAQQIQSPQLLYLWQWQCGRLLKDSGDSQGAIAAYKNAIASLRAIQTDLAAGGGNSPGGISFRQAAGDVYYELADLLLVRAASQPDPLARQTDLADARDTVEQLKTAELQNYFQDRCERLLDQQKRGIESIDPHTAVVYFVPLASRVEILVGVAGQNKPFIWQCSTRVPAQELSATARRFRVEVRDQSSEEYFQDGRKLYDWLIAPVEPFLASRGGTIDTLVFVPDGALRSIPMAALADSTGKFLIEKYAVAVSPGLRLTEAVHAGNVPPRSALLLINGLSVARQGFAPLPFVTDEVQKVDDAFSGNGKVLLNDQFVTANIDEQLRNSNYSIVHIASHGNFGGQVQDTYVLDYDGRLDLDELERLIEPSKYRQRPVDLLTLSACETAAGDDRAALGLAGVAVKAGALSALATLWAVNDRSSSILLPAFYEHLRDPGGSKAKALRAAQLTLLSDRRFFIYRHPFFWSPYLIVGNWL